MSSVIVDARTQSTSWIKRFGVIGFTFFFVKGLLWMAAPVVFYHLM